jgi:hypothetical protein
MRTFLLCTIMLLLCACYTAPELTNLEAAPRTIPPAAVNLANYQAPQTIGPFTLQGDMAASASPSRLFRYTSSNAGQSLSILIYPLPGGWELMDADQQIAGHYGQVRQDAVKRLIQRGATRVEIENEQIHEDPDSQVLTAESSIIATSERATATQTLLLRRSGPIFVRLGLTDSEKINNIDLARSTLNTFVNAVAGAPAANSGNSFVDKAR